MFREKLDMQHGESIYANQCYGQNLLKRNLGLLSIICTVEVQFPNPKPLGSDIWGRLMSYTVATNRALLVTRTYFWPYVIDVAAPIGTLVTLTDEGFNLSA